MAIGTPTFIGEAGAAASSASPTVITTSVTANVGDLVFLCLGGSSSRTPTGVTDSAGNTYTLGTVYSGGTLRVAFAYSILTSQLASSGTISVAATTTSGRGYYSAFSVTGMDATPFDNQGAGNTGTSQIVSATPLFSSITPTNNDSLIITATQFNDSSSSTDTWTEDADYTSLETTIQDLRILRPAYKIVSSTSAIDYAPENSTSRTWASNYIIFQGTAAGGGGSAVHRNFTLMGVG